MKAESTIHVCGFDVRMRYCAAAETSYEKISGRPIDTFLPSSGEDGKQQPPKAMTEDYILLAVGAVIAAYSATNEEPPVNATDILYEATPNEVVQIVSEVVKLRAQWYDVPSVIENEGKQEGEQEKNA